MLCVQSLKASPIKKKYYGNLNNYQDQVQEMEEASPNLQSIRTSTITKLKVHYHQLMYEFINLVGLMKDRLFIFSQEEIEKAVDLIKQHLKEKISIMEQQSKIKTDQFNPYIVRNISQHKENYQPLFNQEEKDFLMGEISALERKSLEQGDLLSEALNHMIEFKFEKSLKMFIQLARSQRSDTVYNVLVALLSILLNTESFKSLRKIEGQQTAKSNLSFETSASLKRYYNNIWMQESMQKLIDEKNYFNETDRLFEKIMDKKKIVQRKNIQDINKSLERMENNHYQTQLLSALFHANFYQEQKLPLEKGLAKHQLSYYQKNDCYNLRADELAASLYLILQRFSEALKLFRYILIKITFYKHFIMKNYTKSTFNSSLKVYAEKKQAEDTSFVEWIRKCIKVCESNGQLRLQSVRLASSEFTFDLTEFNGEQIVQAISFYEKHFGFELAKKMLNDVQKKTGESSIFLKQIDYSKKQSQYEKVIKYYKQYFKSEKDERLKAKQLYEFAVYYQSQQKKEQANQTFRRIDPKYYGNFSKEQLEAYGISMSKPKGDLNKQTSKDLEVNQHGLDSEEEKEEVKDREMEEQQSNQGREVKIGEKVAQSKGLHAQDGYEIVNPSESKHLPSNPNQLKEFVGMMTFYWYDDNNNVVKSVQGTGFLIAEDVVVTARHNFYQRSKLDQKCTSCTIQLRNPKNHSEIITYRSKSSSEWFEHKQWDLGLVFLQKPVRTFKNNVKFITRNEAIEIRKNYQLFLSGYSLEYRQINKADELKILYPKFKSINNSKVSCEYTADTESGLSGSPVFYKAKDNEFYVISLHISRKLPSMACKGIFFTERVVNQIYFWIEYKRSLEIKLPTAFKKLKEDINTMLGKNLERFEEDVYIRDPKLFESRILQSYKERVIMDPSSQKIIDVTSRIIKIGLQQKLETFYGELFAINNIQNAKEELIRLNLKVPPPSVTPSKNKDSLEIASQNVHRSELKCGDKSEVNMIVYQSEIKRSDHSEVKSGNKSEVKSAESTQQSLNESSTQPNNQNSQMILTDTNYHLINESIPSDIGYEMSLDSDQNIDSVRWSRVEVMYQYERGAEHRLLNLYKECKYSIYRSNISILEDHTTTQDGSYLAQIQEAKDHPKGFTFQVEEGFEYTDWYNCMNKQLLLMLVRDVSEGILELLNLGIYHTDLQLRNVILIVNNTETIDFKLLFDREEVLAKMSCLQFKIIDFEYALSFYNKKSSEMTLKMLQYGKQLYENSSTMFNQQPLYELINKTKGEEGLDSEGPREKIDAYYQREYQQFLKNQIKRLNRCNNGDLLLTGKQLESLFDLIDDWQLGNMINYITKWLKREFPTP